MPALFSLGMDAAVQRASQELGAEVWLFAYLDDVYAVCSRGVVGRVYQVVKTCLEEECGIRVNTGKCYFYDLFPSLRDVFSNLHSHSLQALRVFLVLAR